MMLICNPNLVGAGAGGFVFKASMSYTVKFCIKNSNRKYIYLMAEAAGSPVVWRQLDLYSKFQTILDFLSQKGKWGWNKNCWEDHTHAQFDTFHLFDLFLCLINLQALQMFLIEFCRSLFLLPSTLKSFIWLFLLMGCFFFFF